MFVTVSFQNCHNTDAKPLTYGFKHPREIWGVIQPDRDIDHMDSGLSREYLSYML